ncbi:tyrosine-protein phosphatase [Actinokineospora inagensis]|uniref:tyrosine-protein phosphatase n=1 Tax=Actinokineospora inagensis TaxID=103730 RepID=UPI000417A307|nr:tyrosine-protein phosphatase [Actinokineospora inagensis]
MRHHRFERLNNFRDLGGYRTADGTTLSWNVYYRSDSLGKLAGPDLERFRDLGVRTVIDLRHQHEIDKRGRVPDLPDLAYHHLPVERRPWDLAALDEDRPVGRFLADRYREVAEDGRVELRTALEVLADSPGPAVFHCAAGKDRTGLLAALVLLAVGVAEADVVADYALTALVRTRLMAEYRAEGNESTWPGFGHAPAEAMELALVDLVSDYGSPTAYLRDYLGVSDTTVRGLREKLTHAWTHRA